MIDRDLERLARVLSRAVDRTPGAPRRRLAGGLDPRAVERARAVFARAVGGARARPLIRAARTSGPAGGARP